jgi:hypothetical protein
MAQAPETTFGGPMSDEAETFRAATRLIEQHGEGAALVAEGHAASARQGGDPLAARQWQRIAQAIHRLQSATREGEG